MKLDEKLVNRESISIDDSTGCWNWLKAKNQDGYGYVWDQGKMHRAHKKAYELFIGPIPDGVLVLHRCDNRACINPEHLFLGTHQDNATDRNLKDRQVRGERHPNARITFAQVVEYKRIKDAASQAGRRYSSKVAREAVGLPKTTTDHIDGGRRWKGFNLYTQKEER